ncbi:hypothetical protein [Mesobacillus boroniphilus]|uniref:hypothetical protein n=1 Tax=Mesobacillus boroniphilus TaxID=308892 RepID=UPI00201B5C84|nr:hypothetical protein [Mesobacillus boroniphilus]
MYKKIFHLFILSILIFAMKIETANAGHDMPKPLKETFREIGYKTVEEAVQEFELHI